MIYKVKYSKEFKKSIEATYLNFRLCDGAK